jgi:hypothetical protein
MKVRELLNMVRHIALATVNTDGSPHNTPLFFIYNSDYSKMYWGSHPNSLHSKNIERTGQGYAVVYDSKVTGQGGLYLILKNAHEVTKVELPEALKVHNDTRKRWGKDPLALEYYKQPNPQRMYVADITKIETYAFIQDAEGLVVEETRVETTAEDLLNG